MKPIRTAIVGVGKIAHTHAQALAALPASQFVAVCGLLPGQTADFATQYGVQPYFDLATMIREQDVEMVSICTPHPLHSEQAIAAANAGANVLIEKPMALTVADCDRMIAAAAQAGVKLGVISQRRLYPPVQRVKAAIESGKLGAPIMGVATLLGWRSAEYYAMDDWRGTWAGEGGGVLVNQAVHQLDLFQWLMGPIAEVFAYWGNLNHPMIEVEDTAVAVIRFRGGALGSIIVSNSQNPGLYGYIHVHGHNGATVGVQTESGSAFISGVTTQVDPAFNNVWTIPGETELARWQDEDRQLTVTHNPMMHYSRLQIEDFLNAIAEDRPSMVPGEEGRKAVALIEAIYASQQVGHPVAFTEDGTPLERFQRP